MPTVSLPRFGRRAAIAVAASSLLLGGGVAYAAYADPCASFYKTNPNAGQEIAYERCRFDSIEAKLDALAKPPVTVTVPGPTQTVTVTASPTSSATSSTTTAATTTATTSATTSATTTATSTATAGPCPVAGANKPGASDPWGGCFPGPGNAGVPAGTALTPYAGPQTITVANTRLDGVSASSRIIVNAPGVTITRSRLAGGLGVQSGNPTITDSYVESQDYSRGIDGDGYTAQRNEIRGGPLTNSGGWCSHCIVTDNWIVNDDPRVFQINPQAHMSAFRMDEYTYLSHNTLACTLQPSPQDGGCSANLTGYGDFQPVNNNTINRNLFVANPNGVAFCSYGGSSGQGGVKQYGDQTHDIVFTQNVFQRGSNNQCGAYRAVGDYNPSKPGNIPGAGNGNDWTAAGNRYDDGTLMGPNDFGG